MSEMFLDYQYVCTAMSSMQLIFNHLIDALLLNHLRRMSFVF